MPPQIEPQAITVAEAAKRLNVCTTTIRRYLRQKRLKSFKLCSAKNGAYRIPIKEIEKLLNGK